MSYRLIGWLLFAQTLTSAGCGTIVNLRRPVEPVDPNASPYVYHYDRSGKQVYGGVRYDLLAPDWDELLDLPHLPGPFAVIALLLELPLSAIADTLTLPITIPATMRRYNASPPAPANPPPSTTPAATSQTAKSPIANPPQ
jgi:uncharacterized protein YceK